MPACQFSEDNQSEDSTNFIFNIIFHSYFKMKRRQEDFANLVNEVDIIMLDIEGTTTSISFVKVSEDARAGVEPLPTSHSPEVLIPALVATVAAMMDADSKVPALKALQGHMWHRAYLNGAITGQMPPTAVNSHPGSYVLLGEHGHSRCFKETHPNVSTRTWDRTTDLTVVYNDVVEALQQWKKAGKRLVVYSSGSVQAQKLLFSHSCHGDLLHYFSDHFDTSVGAKVEAGSYRTILQALHSPPPEKVLFITDLVKEARAAEEVGMRVVVSVREGTVPLSPHDLEHYPVIHSFTHLLNPHLSPSKRASREQQKPEEEEKQKEQEEKQEKQEEENAKAEKVEEK
ncbi:enolase-phosphatase E1 isoform X2 [Cherax quadricarinatus]|uniref:enolase-phosphatase E1 isoform X2 n=1 Tax=Cherax quadricarinatus TaxID=27406 RepID=UPI0023796BE8|nr:enolase-phosphatase E1-like isoform X2 [Cherax quadricarinatus]